MKEIQIEDLIKTLEKVLESAPSIEVQQKLIDEVENLQKEHSLSQKQAVEYVIGPYLNDIVKIKKNS